MLRQTPQETTTTGTQVVRRFIPLLALLITVITASSAIAQRPEGKTSWVNPRIANVKGLDHKILASKSLGHKVGYAVFTPPGYDHSGTTRYPVIYFLHGAGGTEASDSGGFSSRVASGIGSGTFPKAICLFPNGGMSGYRDGVESMIIDELIPLIDRDYRTKAEPSGRVLAGFSMGGAGVGAVVDSSSGILLRSSKLGWRTFVARKLSLQEYLVADNWDHVTVQQMSVLSFKAAGESS